MLGQPHKKFFFSGPALKRGGGVKAWQQKENFCGFPYAFKDVSIELFHKLFQLWTLLWYYFNYGRFYVDISTMDVSV